jgi:sulfatase maturation enzyme AslB (radical SAM superfamily)
MLSTNSFLGYEYVSKFIFGVNNICKKYNKQNFKLIIQFSLDGPPWINERSRKIGATQKTIDTIETILEKVNQENFNYSLSLSVKSTLSI